MRQSLFLIVEIRTGARTTCLAHNCLSNFWSVFMYYCGSFLAFLLSDIATTDKFPLVHIDGLQRVLVFGAARRHFVGALIEDVIVGDGGVDTVGGVKDLLFAVWI